MKALAVTAVLLGLLAIASTLVFPTGGLVLGIAAMATALLPMRESAGRAAATVGLTLGALAVAGVVALVIFGSEPQGGTSDTIVIPPGATAVP